jgi:hypothetical protein
VCIRTATSLAPLPGISHLSLVKTTYFFFLRTKNSLNLHWLLLFASFPSGDSIEQICQVYCKEQSLWLLEILGEEALTGIQFLFQLNNLTFVFLLVFTLSDALVCFINLVIWRLHFKNNLTKYSSRRNSRLVFFILELEKVFG